MIQRNDARHNGSAMATRRGFTLLELGVATILLAAMLTITLQFFRATAAHRQSLQAKRIALCEVANVMERLAARPWDEITAEAAGNVQLSPLARETLPDAKLDINVVQPEDQKDAKRLSVVLRWPAGPERPDHAVGLVAWRYRIAGR